MHDWVYEGPTGDEHAFYSNAYTANAAHNANASVQFTIDGTHMRMSVLGSSRSIEFPNGIKHTFLFERNEWRLKTITDRFNNNVTIDYAYWSGTDNRVTQWTIQDSTGRAHTVVFQYFSDMAEGVDRGMNVDYIDLRGVDGPGGAIRTARYDFEYTLTDIPFPISNYHDVPVNYPGGPPSATTTPFPLLTSVQMPDDTTSSTDNPTYTFTYKPADLPDDPFAYSQGHISTMTLPTRGVIRYTYQPYSFPDQDACVQPGPRNSSPGIKTRDLDGNIWRYFMTLAPEADVVYDVPGPSDPPQCSSSESDTRVNPRWPQRWSRTSILGPPENPPGDRTRTDHYFHIYVGSSRYHDNSLHADTADIAFGEPITVGWPGAAAAKLVPPDVETAIDQTAGDTGASDQRYLSEQVWSSCASTGDCSDGTLLRSAYRRYSHLGWLANGGRRALSERTLMHDDTGCGGTCYAQTDFSDYDGVGHLRTTTTSSNFPGSAGDTKRIGYLQWTPTELLDPATIWTFDRYTEQSRTVNGQTARSTFCFNSDGQLTRQRVLADNAIGPHDIITAFTYTDSLGINKGNVIEEKTYGGDTQTLDQSQQDLCMTPLGTPSYWNRYTYAYGTLASSQYLTSAGAPLSFKSIEYTVDPGTGLVTGSTNTDGLVTAYGYKRWGALESLTPPGENSTTYTYTPATLSTFASVGLTTGGVTTIYEYDRLGRLRRTQRTLPGAGCVEQLVGYDQVGRKAQEMTWHACGAGSASTYFWYDSLGRITTITAPDAQQTTMSYTGNRFTTRTSNLSGLPVTTREERDLLGRLVRVTENYTPPAGGVTTSYTYDAGDRLTSVAAGAQTRIFTYDHRGFLRAEQHPELGAGGNGTASYIDLADPDSNKRGYDARGHSRRRITGTYDITTTYDAAERVISVRENSSNRYLKEFLYDNFPSCTRGNGKLCAAARYQYDPDLGNPGTTALAVTETYQYDLATGRPARRDRHIEQTANYLGGDFRHAQTHNASGNVQQIDYPCPTITNASGAVVCDPSFHQLATWNGYTNGMLTNVGTPVVGGLWASSITYHPTWVVDTVTHGSGASAIRETWLPDPHGIPRPCNIFAAAASMSIVADANSLCGKRPAGPPLWTTGEYQYDGTGNITRAGATSYVYDALNRLTAWTTTSPDGSFANTTQGYDANGNKTYNTYRGCGPSPNGRCYSTSFIPRELAGTSNHYVGTAYDAAGSVVSEDPNRTFTYDSLGILTRAVVDGRDFRFLYTPDDERIAAVERVTGSDLVVRNKSTFTLRGFNNQLLSVWTRDTAGVLAWREDEIWRSSALLAREAPSGTRHYSLDHLGTPRAITNPSGGLVGVQSFDVFGAGGTSDGGALQFTGQERDAANLADGGVALPDYFHARYYDLAGRFLSVDPVIPTGAMRNPQMWNRYSYVANNPLNRVDPDGKLLQIAGCSDTKSETCQKNYNLYLSTFGKQSQQAAKYLQLGKNGMVSFNGISGGMFAAKFGTMGRASNFLISNRSATFSISADASRVDHTGGNYATTRYGNVGAEIAIDLAGYPQKMGGITQSATGALAHELGHALGTLLPGIRDAFDAQLAHSLLTMHEGYGTAFENQWRREQGMDQRLFYKYLYGDVGHTGDDVFGWPTP